MSRPFLHSRSRARGAACLIAALALSCKSGVDTSLPDEFLMGPPIQLEIRPATLTLVTGDYFTLVPVAFDAKGHRVNTAVEWTSSDPSIATVGRFDGVVTGILVGQAAIKASDGAFLQATALVTVRAPNPPAFLVIQPAELFLAVGGTSRLNVKAYDVNERLVPANVAWSSRFPNIATVDSSGVVTAIAVGQTEVVASVGFVTASIQVRVEPPGFLMQWASLATASTQYSDGGWSAAQAIGEANVHSCLDESNAWASIEPSGTDWLELTYNVPVRPSEIRIHEVWAPGSIVKVEVKDLAGTYYTVYEAVPKKASATNCFLRTLVIPVTAVGQFVNVVRVSIDQRVIQDWNEIDAVRLIGYLTP